jgi:hypothetical protein
MAKQFGNKADGQGGSESSSERWIDQELAGCEFQDERLTKRFEKLFGSFHAASARVFHGLVRTGQTPRLLIGSLPTSG